MTKEHKQSPKVIMTSSNFVGDLSPLSLLGTSSISLVIDSVFLLLFWHTDMLGEIEMERSGKSSSRG